MISWRSVCLLFCALCDLGLVLMATDYGLDIWRGGSPITPEQYGEAVYQIPAVAWAAFQWVAALVGMIGAIVLSAEQDRALSKSGRIGAALCFIGNLCLTSMFVVFASLSRDAELGILLHSMSKFPGTMIYGGITVLAGRLLFWGDESVESMGR